MAHPQGCEQPGRSTRAGETQRVKTEGEVEAGREVAFRGRRVEARGTKSQRNPALPQGTLMGTGAEHGALIRPEEWGANDGHQ